MEKGTLFQLRNVINRRNVSAKPKANVNAAEDFFEIAVIGYVISTTMSYLQMSSLEEVPYKNITLEEVKTMNDLEKIAILHDISSHLVDQYIDLATMFKDTSVTTGEKSTGGTAYDYTCEVLSLGLLFLNFKDSIREGDGDRILLMWKYFMLIFKAMGHKNYAAEALTLLSQCHITLPQNLAEQLKWSRFINTRGLPGHNVSCDLHMEHLNRLVKVAIDGLGANKGKTSILRVGKAIGSLACIASSVDRGIGVAEPSARHSEKGMAKDLVKIVEQILLQDILSPKTTAVHRSFSRLKKNVIKNLEESKIKKWLVECVSYEL